MPVTLKQALDLQKEFDKQHQGNYPFYETINSNNIEALEHLLVCLTGEVGELANIIKKIRRGDFDLSEASQNINDELADIFIYILKISNQLDVDLEKAFLNKRDLNFKRFERYSIK